MSNSAQSGTARGAHNSKYTRRQFSGRERAGLYMNVRSLCSVYWSWATTFPSVRVRAWHAPGFDASGICDLRFLAKDAKDARQPLRGDDDAAGPTDKRPPKKSPTGQGGH